MNCVDMAWDIYQETKTILRKIETINDNLTYLCEMPENQASLGFLKFMAEDINQKTESLSEKNWELYFALKKQMQDENIKPPAPLYLAPDEDAEVDEDENMNVSNENDPDNEDEDITERIILGGYIRPFSWTNSYNEVVFKDQIGDAFILKADSRIVPEIHGPLFDKIAKILNTGENINEFPNISASFNKENDKTELVINGFIFKEQSRNGIENHVELLLKKHIISLLMESNDIMIANLLTDYKIYDEKYNDTLFRYKTDQYPFYSPFLFYSSKEETITEITRMLVIQALASGEKKQELTDTVKNLFDEFYSKDSETQYNTRLELAQKLNKLAKADNNDNNNTLSSEIGIYVNQTEEFFRNPVDYFNWAEKHLLHEGDIVVPKTDWETGQFLLTDYSQIENYHFKTIKYTLDEKKKLYNTKLHDYIYDESRIISYLNVIKKKTGTEQGEITIPIPFIEEKKNRKELIAWIQANTFMMGINIRYTPVNTFLRGYAEYRKLNEKTDKGFFKFIKKIFNTMLNDGFVIDNSIDHNKKHEIPDELLARFIEILP